MVPYRQQSTAARGMLKTKVDNAAGNSAISFSFHYIHYIEGQEVAERMFIELLEGGI